MRSRLLADRALLLVDSQGLASSGFGLVGWPTADRASHDNTMGTIELLVACARMFASMPVTVLEVTPLGNPPPGNVAAGNRLPTVVALIRP